MLLPFVVHMCEMIISPEVFFLFFKNFDFPGCQGGRRTKKPPKMTKKSACHAPYLRKHP